MATWGAFAFAATSSFSIVAYEAAFGIAVLGLIFAFAARSLSYRRTACDIPLLTLVVADLLACAFSVHPAHSLRSMRGEWILLFYPVFAQTFRDTRTVRKALTILLVSSSLIAVYAIAQMFTGADLLRGRTLEPIGNLYIATGLFGHHLSYGGHVLITGTLALALAMGVPVVSLAEPPATTTTPEIAMRTPTRSWVATSTPALANCSLKASKEPKVAVISSPSLP